MPPGPVKGQDANIIVCKKRRREERRAGAGEREG